MRGQMRAALLGIAACVASRGAGALRVSGMRPARSALLSLRAGASVATEPAAPDRKLAALRKAMAAAGVGALLVPSGDAHLSEYVHPHYDRRAFISGFTGSAGTALVTSDQALLWTDGRYFLQAETELGPEWSLMRSGEADVPTLHQWVAKNLPDSTGVGIDPKVFSTEEATALENALAGAERELHLVPMSGPSLVDMVWGDGSGEWFRAAAPTGAARSFPLELAGVSREEKLTAAALAAVEAKADAMLVCMLDEVAWLLNVRGTDVPHCPVLEGFVIVNAAKEGEGKKDSTSTATFFVEQSKLPAELAQELAAAGVELMPYSDVYRVVEELAHEGTRFMLDPNKVTYALRRAAGSAAVERSSPLSLPKACKNEAELKGMFNVHYRDGAALAVFFSWLERHVKKEGGRPTEKDIAEQVAAARASFGAFDLSFPTIAGVGPNGAIIHYDCSKAENPAIFDGTQMLLLDSGGQYAEGTTDVTRTIHLGDPTPWEREMFTRVLKGNIGLDATQFPDGTPGMAIDAFARAALWQVGLDYLHGTGHGVGAGLNVHEGPQSISARYGNQVGLREGMICSNEPGYYEAGAFGIRIENLLVVRKRSTKHEMRGRQFLGFDQLTHVPIQKSLMDVSLLTAAEVEWINDYHARVWDNVSPLLPEDTYAEARAWLQRWTTPIKSPLVDAAAKMASGPPVGAIA